MDGWMDGCFVVHSASRMDQTGKVANSSRGHISLSLFAPENLVSRDGFGRPVPRAFSILRLNMVLTHGISPDFRGGVPLFKPAHVQKSSR